MKLYKLLALILAIGLVVAQEDDDPYDPDDSGEDDDESEDEFDRDREVEVDVNDDRVRLVSRVADDDSEEELRYEVNLASNGLEVRFEYSQDGDDEDDEEEVTYRVYMTGLVEYTDADNDGEFDDGDTVVNRRGIPGDGWNAVDLTEEADSVLFNISTTDGVFGVHFVLPKTLLSIDDDVNGNSRAEVPPSLLKFTVNVAYQFTQADTKLALRALVVTRQDDEDPERGDEGEDREGEESVRVTSRDDDRAERVFLSWENFANSDGSSVSVVASSPLTDDPDDDEEEEDPDEEDDEEVRFMYFTINQASTAIDELLNVEWDPALGVRSDAAQLVASVLALAMAALLV